MSLEAHSHAESADRKERLAKQERCVMLGARAGLEVRGVERVLRRRAWDFDGLVPAEALSLADHIDAAIDALISLAQEAGVGLELRIVR